MTESLEETKAKLNQELEKYTTDKGSFKEYYISMKEISDWLKEREK